MQEKITDVDGQYFNIKMGVEDSHIIGQCTTSCMKITVLVKQDEGDTRVGPIPPASWIYPWRNSPRLQFFSFYYVIKQNLYYSVHSVPLIKIDKYNQLRCRTEPEALGEGGVTVEDYGGGLLG